MSWKGAGAGKWGGAGNAGWNNQGKPQGSIKPAGVVINKPITQFNRPATQVGQSIKPAQPAGRLVPATGGPMRPVQPGGIPPKSLLKSSSTGSLNGNGKTPVLTVGSNSKRTDLGVMTLVGDFVESGTNHGRKYYQKVQAIPGHPNVKVFMYYWDTRDGADFSGWWMGDKLGGSEVWARCVSQAMVPPAVGWKVPWNAPKAEPGLLSVLPYRAGRTVLASGGAAPAPVSAGRTIPASGGAAASAARVLPSSGGAAAANPAMEAKVKKATNQVDNVERSAKAVVARAKGLTQGSDAQVLKKILESLTEEQRKLLDVQKSLTLDINEARKGGAPAVASVTEFSKLSPRLRIVTAAVSVELARAKGFVASAEKAAELAKKFSPEELKKMEEKSAKELAELLPACEESATAACEAVEAIRETAAPMLEDPPDAADESFGEVDKAAAAAQTKIIESRSLITAKLATARNFAPEARKKGLAELNALQQKIVEAQKQLTPFKTFKKDFTARVTAKKALTEIAAKLADAELEVEKASMMSIDTSMSEDDIKSAQELITPAKSALATVKGLLDAKLRTATTQPMKDEVTALQGRLAESETRVGKVVASVTRQKENLSLQDVYATAREKVQKAEESMAACGDAELSFLKGIEVLPADESEKAIKESEAASAASTTLMMAAKSYLNTKINEVRRYSKETQKEATEELTELLKRTDEVAKRLVQFKNDTSERKTIALMADAMDVISAAEAKGEALNKASKIFSSENLDNVSVDALKEAGEKTAAVEKECITAVQEARKVVAEKQKVAATNKDLAQGLAKLTTRINVVQAHVTSAKRATLSGSQLVKAKEVSVEAEAKIAEAEGEVAKLVKMSKPDEDGLGVETITDANILEIERMGLAVGTSLKAVTASMQPHAASPAPAIKATMAKFADRIRKANISIAEAKAGTKEQRERVLSQSYVKEGETKTTEVEASLEKLATAEAPYLKGIEVLPLAESKAAMTAADEASAAVQATISAARTLIATKNMDMKKFDALTAKASLADFVKLSERVNAAAQKLNAFKKDTEARKKKALLIEAGEKITALQAEAEKVAEAMKPIMEADADTLSPEMASSMIKGLEELEKAAQASVVDCRTFLAARSRDAQGDADNTKVVQELMGKLTAVQAELAKAKKVSSNHNQKLTAKALVQEAGEMIKDMEAELAKATAACAPVVEEKCDRFLVKVSIGTLCTALKSLMEEKDGLPGLSEEDVFKKMGNTQAKFCAFLAKMPEEFKREECSFSEARQVAMFKIIDADADGKISLEDFKGMFLGRYVCVNTISVTDIFDIGTSKSVCKLELGEVVEGQGDPKPAEDNVPRLKCKIISSGQEGWITTQSNRGTKYLDAVTPFKEFTKELQTTLDATVKSFSKATSFFANKIKELSHNNLLSKDSPMQAAKEELTKLRTQGMEIGSKFQKLKQSVEVAKREFPMLEIKEKNAHIEAKERKEADEVLAPARPKVEAVEAQLKKLEEAAKPLTERQGTDILLAFDTPLTVQEQAKANHEVLKTAAEEAKSSLKERQELVAKAVKGPLMEAKKDLVQWSQKVSQALLAANKVIGAVRACCNTIAICKLQLTATTIRADLLSQGKALEDLFGNLAPDGERIPEQAFVSYVSGLKGLDLPSDHAKLLARQIEVGGVGRRAFMRFLQKYFKVVKEIAITPVFDIVDSKEKPVRKADVDEVVELIEGPTLDEKSGLERVKIKAIKDGAEGWVSVKGNQGKVFLTEVEKPFYVSMKDAALEKEFVSNSENAVRAVKADEVFELLEGPRQETLGSVTRLRGKASSDGKIGWITVKDQHGTEFAEKGGKFYTCTSTVAITDVFDIKVCKVLKKLEINEVFTVLEGPNTDDSGMARVKGKSSKDDLEGWITIKGNAGTIYAKVNDKLYTVKKEVSLQQRLQSDSPVTRTLAADEGFELIEGPKEEKFLPANRIKVRASSDRAVGWLTLKVDGLRSWKSGYKYIKAAPLYASKGTKESVVREVALGEIVEVVEGPVQIEEVMWVKVQLKKDGVVGWAPMKNEEGAKVVVMAM